MTAAAVDRTLGELLSPSQINTFLSCLAKWYFRYALGLAEPQTGTLALGSVHSVAGGQLPPEDRNQTGPSRARNSKSRLAKRSRWRPRMRNFAKMRNRRR